jgi:hypothetical protein
MQIRCHQCHRPFALTREAVQFALEEIVKQELSHYNADCPHCRRVNRVSKAELLRAAPDWQPAAEEPEQPEQPE